MKTTSSIKQLGVPPSLQVSTPTGKTVIRMDKETTPGTLTKTKSGSILEGLSRKLKTESSFKKTTAEAKRNSMQLTLNGILDKSETGTGADGIAPVDIPATPTIPLTPVLNEFPTPTARDQNPALTRRKSTSNALSSMAASGSKSSNIKVAVRFRPLNSTETEFISNKIGFITPEFVDQRSLYMKTEEEATSSSGSTPFSFDRVFNLESSQVEIYDDIGREMILDVCNGYNGTIFTYGQSGSGKTFTMYGRDLYDETWKGIVPRAIDHLFEFINDPANDHIVFQLKFSILQIYKEVIHDLLTGVKDLKIKESPVRGIYVDKLSEVFIDSIDTFMELIEASQEQRIVAETKLNHCSSRSHTIFILEVNQSDKETNITKKGILYLVDLAGSEKIKKTGAVGETLEQAKKINLSLSALGNVIHALTTNSDFIPYRDSKLTRILQESLGGNYKTTLVVTCSPHSYHMEESTSSLKFAQRVKTIKNKVRVNIKLSYEELQRIIANLRLELEAANNQILILNNLLKGKGNVEDNIIQLIETQNVKNIVEQEIQKSDNKILLAETEGNGNLNNGLGSPKINCDLSNNEPADLEKLAKKLKMIKKRKDFKNATCNIIVEKEKEDSIMDSNESMSVSCIDDNEEKMEQMKQKLCSKDHQIKQLEDQIKALEEKCELQEQALKENNKDLYLSYQQLTEKITALLTERRSQKQVSSTIDKELLAKVTSAIDNFDNMIDSLLSEMNLHSAMENTMPNFNSHRVLQETFSLHSSPSSEEDRSNTNFITNLLTCFNEHFTLPLTEIYNKHLVQHSKTLRNENLCMINLIDELLSLSKKMGERLSSETTTHISHPKNPPKRFNSLNVGENRDRGTQGEGFNSLSNVLSKIRCETFVTKKNIGVMRNTVRRSSWRGINNDEIEASESDIASNKSNSCENEESEEESKEQKANISTVPKVTEKTKRRTSYSEPVDLENCIKEFATLKEFVIKSFSQMNQLQTTFDAISKVLVRTDKKYNDNKKLRINCGIDGENEDGQPENSMIDHNHGTDDVFFDRAKTGIKPTRHHLRLENEAENKPSMPTSLKKNFHALASSVKNVESLIMKYSRTGTASRKFDGIKFKLSPFNNLDLLYEGGINCDNQILAPLHDKAICSKGDTTVPEVSISLFADR